MDSEQPAPDTWIEHQAVTERTSDERAETQAEERADIEEDRRRQREMDEGEMGGES
jgi:hypothetical protein